MYLSSLEIKDFRLFTEFATSFCPSLNVLVGENNSGKSAVIDAIRFTLDTNSSEWIRINETDFRRGQSKFSILLRFDQIEPRHAKVFLEHLTHEIHDGKRRSVLWVKLTAEITNTISRGNRVIRSEIRSGENGEGPQIDRDIRQYLSATYLRPLRDAEAEMTASRGSRLSQVLQSSSELQDAATIEGLLTVLVNANDAIMGNDGIAQTNRRITTQLNHLSFATSALEPVIEILGGRDLTALSDPERQQMFRGLLERLRLVIDKDDRIQGLGYNNLLFMAAELLLLKQSTGEFPLLLIEEPEAHLHPQLQMKFLRALQSDFGGKGKPPLQSILTSHSPNLASKAPLGSVIVMAGGKAFPLRDGQTGLDSDDYEFLQKFLDVTKSNLFFAKAVIIVEGDGENILLPTIAEILGRPLEDYGVSVVNVGSTAFARYAKIFHRAGKDDVANSDEWMPIRVVCLRDLDRWPARAEKKDKNDAIGFKERKEPGPNARGNLDYWQNDAASIAARTASLKKLEKQSVKVEVSDFWTFEYSLIVAGLEREVFEASRGKIDGFADLSKDDEERALQIFGYIEGRNGAKTETAYELSKILMRDYRPAFAPDETHDTEQHSRALGNWRVAAVGKRNDLRRKLPDYILRALAYVTKDFPPLPPSDGSANASNA
jgi:putative ATP-dependent endonuclease of OLD family